MDTLFRSDFPGDQTSPRMLLSYPGTHDGLGEREAPSVRWYAARQADADREPMVAIVIHSARRRLSVLSVSFPGTATDDPFRGHQPRIQLLFSAILGVIGVAGEDAAGGFPDVACHVLAAIRAGSSWIAPDGGCPCTMRFAEMSAVRVPLIAPGVAASIGAARGFLPFDFAGHIPVLAGQLREPGCVSGGECPVHIGRMIEPLLQGGGPVFYAVILVFYAVMIAEHSGLNGTGIFGHGEGIGGHLEGRGCSGELWRLIEETIDGSQRYGFEVLIAAHGERSGGNVAHGRKHHLIAMQRGGDKAQRFEPRFAGPHRDENASGTGSGMRSGS